MSPASLDRDFARDFAARWLDAWNRHDGDGVARLCTDDVEFTDPAIGTVRGRAAVAGWIGALGRAFPDYRFEEREPFYPALDRPRVLAPWRMSGTHTGPLDPPGFAATGRAVVVEGVDHAWLRDGLVERYRTDYDVYGVLRQLGIVPAAGSRAERAMVFAQRLSRRARTRRRSPPPSRRR